MNNPPTDDRDRGIQVNDVVKIKGFDRCFLVGGIIDKGTHPDNFTPCKVVRISMQAFGGRGWLATYPEHELEFVSHRDVK